MEPQSKPFTLRVVRSSGSINPSTIVEASMARKHTNNKNIQLEVWNGAKKTTAEEI